MKAQALRVGFCENGAGYGGAIISLAALLAKLPRQFRPYIYTGLDTAQYRRLARLGTWRHVPAVALLGDARLPRRAPFASTVDNLLNLLPSALRYYATFKRDRIDLVYLNNDVGCNVAAALAARMAGLPMILHARGFNSDTRASRWMCARLDHCIAVSSAVRDQLLSLGVAPDKCTVVAEGLDLTEFHPQPASAALLAELGVLAGEPVVTLVGGLVDWKGQDVLLEAAPAILERFPQAHILLVGGAYGKDGSFASAIAAAARAPHLRGRVRLLGARDDVAAILAASSVVLHASTKPEPFGRTFLEGMALGRPVIASNEGGPLDVIEHGVDALLIRPRDPHELARQVLAVLEDPALAARLGENAARKARAYSIERHTEQVCEVLGAAERRLRRR